MPSPLINRRVLFQPRAASGGAPPPSYVRTAFISATGNDGTAVLNDPNFPFNNLSAVAAALYAAYPGLPTTIRLLDNFTGDIGSGVQYLLPYGLTIRSHDATRRTLAGTVRLYGVENSGTSDLSLVNVEVQEIGETHSTYSTETIGTLRGDSTSIVGTLNLNGSLVIGDGANGGHGVNSTGNNGTNGLDGDPPTPGSDGDSVWADGSPGQDGQNGNTAWFLNLISEAGFTINNLNAIGSAATNGGTGGNGATATGGHGGNGGHATGTDQDGANGGNGGNASANGGAGGNGGNGGEGGLITLTGSVTIVTADYSPGAGGDKGLGGAPGTATAGDGGIGGDRTGGGNFGSNGNPGTASATLGTDGYNGNPGAVGGIV